MKVIHSLRAKDLMLLLALIVFTVLTINIFTPYINIVILSLILVQLFHPIYALIKKYTKSGGLATTLSIILVIVLIVVPIALIVSLTVNEIQNVISTTKILDNLEGLQGFKDSINQAVQSINGLSANFSKLDLQTVITNFNQSNNVVNQVLPVLRDLITFGGGLIFAIFILILCLIYMFPAYENLPTIFARFSPLDSKYDDLIYSKFINTLKGTINGTFVVAIAQATAVIIPMILMGVGAPVLLWIIMLILSIIPIGSGLVWAPVGVIMIIQGIANQTPGNVLGGIFLIVYSAIIINVVDSVLRPRLIKGQVNIHPLITILSVIGGIGLFGFFGILYGPLVVVLFMTLLDIYKTNHLDQKDNEEAS